MSHLHDPSPDSAQSVSRLGESLAHTTESQCLLAQEMAAFAKDEGLRFVNLRLERNGTVLGRLQNCHGVPGLMGVQQEWLRDFLQDYAGQSMRLMGALRGLARNVVAATAESVSGTIDPVQHGAGDGMDQAGDAVRQSQDAGYQPVSTIVTDLNNNYVQH